MPFALFHTHFPELAEQETRTLTVPQPRPGFPPPGQYALLEMYCDEPGCDCRRVFFYVVSSNAPAASEAMAVVAYGWETADFYARWMRDDDPELVRALQGPILNEFSPQSKDAPEILRLIATQLRLDPSYVARLKRHYALFRQRIEGRSRKAGKHGEQAVRRDRGRSKSSSRRPRQRRGGGEAPT